MSFLKLNMATAYATGGLRTNLDLAHLVAKLNRQGLHARMRGNDLLVDCGDETWTFDVWQNDGVGRIGWVQMKPLGDAGALSRLLARAGIRHRFDYSRPRDLATHDVRCVTQYDYRWEKPGLPPRSAQEPDITMFDEQI